MVLTQLRLNPAMGPTVQPDLGMQIRKLLGRDRWALRDPQDI